MVRVTRPTRHIGQESNSGIRGYNQDQDPAARSALNRTTSEGPLVVADRRELPHGCRTHSKDRRTAIHRNGGSTQVAPIDVTFADLTVKQDRTLGAIMACPMTSIASLLGQSTRRRATVPAAEITALIDVVR
jgi:hypothetical protein